MEQQRITREQAEGLALGVDGDLWRCAIQEAAHAARLADTSLFRGEVLAACEHAETARMWDAVARLHWRDLRPDGPDYE